MKRLFTGLMILGGFQAQAEVKYIEDVVAEALEKEKDIAKVFESIELKALNETKGAYNVIHVAKDSPFSQQGIKVGDILYARDE